MTASTCKTALRARIASHCEFATDTSPAQWSEILPAVKQSGVRVLIDHFGGWIGKTHTLLPSKDHLAALSQLRDPFVKLTTSNRLSTDHQADRDLDSTVEGIHRVFGADRMIWGSGWPFINRAKPVDHTVLTDNLARWIPDEAVRRRVVWDTPSTVFGFSAPVASPFQ